MSSFQIQLQHYEGPLDLLLDLIRKQQINIYDIPIAKITSQYLSYMDQAMAMDIELSSEFVYMAATLIHIKSKLLLPRDPELEKIMPEEDPRQELVDRLLEHERFKGAAQMLEQKRQIEEAIWTNPQVDRLLGEDQDPGLAVTLFDLVKTLEAVLDRAKNRPIYEITGEEVTVPEMIQQLRNVFDQVATGDHFSAREMFERQKSRRAMICLFLAILEMVKRQALNLVQDEIFGEIVLARSESFAEAFPKEADLEAVEQEYK
ncbi:segregation and condensation protein A [Bryobacter aggregatus]|uniref:segregation and condensation protein A n=1 Tax=Bryobacter aggregatus TaxID=360054 RepID=UPI00056B48EB|nr:segregation/condensation protein A [Bryobacter aggregatus]